MVSDRGIGAIRFFPKLPFRKFASYFPLKGGGLNYAIRIISLPYKMLVNIFFSSATSTTSGSLTLFFWGYSSSWSDF